MAATPAIARRYAAIKALCGKLLPADGGYELIDVTPEQVADMIRELRPLGRTQRWQGTVEGWAAMALEATDADTWTTPEARRKHLKWAIIQGSVYVAYAAE